VASLVFSHETLNGLVKKYAPLIPVSFRNKFVNWHNRKLAASFDTVIATTEFAAAEFVRIKTTNLRKVALGVDLAGFNPENRDHKLRKELLKGAEYLLVHCGRMSPEKEPARSVQAVSELVKAGVNVRLIIVGGGPLWNKIRKQSLGLPIEMLGYVASREKVAGYLAAADIAIAPGPLETFCLSALESLASGTPVVASKSSAVGEILNINSIRPAGAVASDNGADFAIAIKQLLNKGRLRKVAREQAEKFSWANTVDAMLDVHGAKQPMVTTKRRLKVA
jgi:alpha-1,6-mannosyltransferase